MAPSAPRKPAGPDDGPRPQPAVPARRVLPRRGKGLGASGFSLVELLVGMALGLLLVAAAGTWAAAPLQAQRRTQAEARLMQELRAAADLVTRDLRRAGHWGGAAAAAAARASGEAVVANPYADVQAAASSAGGDRVTYAYAHAGLGDSGRGSGPLPQPGEQFGWRLNPRTQAIDLRVSDSGPGGAGERWQQLTDPRSLRVTRLDIQLGQHRAALPEACPGTPCAADPSACPVQVVVREFTVHVAGHAPGHPAVTRALSSQVRVRNDAVQGRCPA